MSLVNFLIEGVSWLLLIVIAIFIITWLYDFLKGRTIETFVMSITPASNRLYKAKRISSEEIVIALDRKKRITKYVGVEPWICDVKKHPSREISRLKVVELYFLQEGKPYVHSSPIDPTFVSQERKLKVLIERGFYQIVVDKLTDEQKNIRIHPDWELSKYVCSDEIPLERIPEIQRHPKTQEQILVLECSDVDFCRADYKHAMHIDAYNEFQVSSKYGFMLNKLTKMALVFSMIAIVYFVIRWNFLIDVLVVFSDILRVIF